MGMRIEEGELFEVEGVVGTQEDGGRGEPELALGDAFRLTPAGAGELACHLAAWATRHGVDIDILTEVVGEMDGGEGVS